MASVAINRTTVISAILSVGIFGPLLWTVLDHDPIIERAAEATSPSKLASLTAGDWALLLGLALNAAAIMFSAVLLSKRVELVHKEMNGMKDALIAAAKLEGLHIGEAKARAEAEIDQG